MVCVCVLMLRWCCDRKTNCTDKNKQKLRKKERRKHINWNGNTREMSIEYEKYDAVLRTVWGTFTNHQQIGWLVSCLVLSEIVQFITYDLENAENRMALVKHYSISNATPVHFCSRSRWCSLSSFCVCMFGFISTSLSFRTQTLTNSKYIKQKTADFHFRFFFLPILHSLFLCCC